MTKFHMTNSIDRDGFKGFQEPENMIQFDFIYTMCLK